MNEEKYITREELSERIIEITDRMEENLKNRDERLIKEMSMVFAEKMGKIMTEQTDRLLKSLSFYEKMTEKHEKNFQNMKNSIE